MLAVALTAGCERGDAASAPAGENTEMQQAGAKRDATAALVAPDGMSDSVPTQRKLIQTGSLSLEVQAYDETRRKLDGQLEAVGGYIENAEIQHHEGEVSRAVLRIRIPRGKLAAFMTSSSEHGNVLNEALRTEDVSDSYFDTEARLKNARKLEGRLLELMVQKTDGVKDLLEVERELARVRETIERFEGQLNNFDKRVAFSTLELQLVTRKEFAKGVPPTMVERVSQTWSSSVGALASAGRAVVIALIAVVPWVPPLGLFGMLLFWLHRRVDRKRKQLATASD